MNRIPWSPTMKLAIAGAGVCSFALLVWALPDGSHDHAVAGCLLAASVTAWIIVLGVHLRDTCVATVNRTIAAAVEQTRTTVREEIAAILEQTTAVRSELAAHDRRLDDLATAIVEYGDERETAARVAREVTDRRNGQNGHPTPATVHNIR